MSQKELVNFLKYVETPDKTENSEDDDDFIKSLKKQIAAIKK